MDKITIEDKEYDVYFKSENEKVFCLGIRFEEDEYSSFPTTKYGKGVRLSNQEMVGGEVLFYNKEREKFYNIKILKYIPNKQPRFIVQYENEKEKEIQCRNLIKNCQITNVVNDFQSLNNFYPREDYWVMEVVDKETGEIVEVLFDGDEETVNGIKNSSWFLFKNGKGDSTYYLMTGSFNQSGKGISLHQIVYGKVQKGNVVNHKRRDNGNWKDNRKSNLEEISKSENAKSRVGAGYPITKGIGWRYSFSVNGYKLQTPTKPTYEEADLDSLIIQEHFNLKHREFEWVKTKEVSIDYRINLIKTMEDKLEKAKSRQKINLDKNKYEIEEYEGGRVVKVYEGKGRYCLIDEEDLWVLDKGRVSVDKYGYWYIATKEGVYRLHRFLLGVLQSNLHDEIQVDHIGREKWDNRKIKLLVTTLNSNSSNKKGKGFSFSKGYYKVHYYCYWKYISKHLSINSSKEPTSKIEAEAKEEVYRRKYLVDKIRPKFKDYEDYVTFKAEFEINKKEGETIDDYYILTRFPNINDIEIPKYVEKDVDK